MLYQPLYKWGLGAYQRSPGQPEEPGKPETNPKTALFPKTVFKVRVK